VASNWERCWGHQAQFVEMPPDVYAPILQFKLLMSWNQEELDQWSVAQQQKEEDNQALEKYK
jgi:hypothetical protein